MFNDTVAEIKRTIGRKNTMILIAAYKDKWLHVPLPEYLINKPDHPLVKLLGEEDALELARAFPSLQISLPKMMRLIESHRDKRIVEMYLYEMNHINRKVRAKALTVIFDMTIQNVYRVLNRDAIQNEEQINMFSRF